MEDKVGNWSGKLKSGESWLQRWEKVFLEPRGEPMTLELSGMDSMGLHEWMSQRPEDSAGRLADVRTLILRGSKTFLSSRAFLLLLCAFPNLRRVWLLGGSFTSDMMKPSRDFAARHPEASVLNLEEMHLMWCYSEESSASDPPLRSLAYRNDFLASYPHYGDYYQDPFYQPLQYSSGSEDEDADLSGEEDSLAASDTSGDEEDYGNFSHISECFTMRTLLSYLPSLRVLRTDEIGIDVGPSGISMLAAHSKLEHLRISRTSECSDRGRVSLRDRDVLQLARGVPNLRSLVLENVCYLEGSFLPVLLARCPRLDHLALYLTDHYDHSLSALRVEGNQWIDKDAQELLAARAPARLRVLELAALTDNKSLAELLRLLEDSANTLERLSMLTSQFTDELVAFVASLSRLQVLRCPSAWLQNEGMLNALMGLPSLCGLVLVNENLEDASNVKATSSQLMLEQGSVVRLCARMKLLRAHELSSLDPAALLELLSSESLEVLEVFGKSFPLECVRSLRELIPGRTLLPRARFVRLDGGWQDLRPLVSLKDGVLQSESSDMNMYGSEWTWRQTLQSVFRPEVSIEGSSDLNNPVVEGEATWIWPQPTDGDQKLFELPPLIRKIPHDSVYDEPLNVDAPPEAGWETATASSTNLFEGFGSVPAGGFGSVPAATGASDSGAAVGSFNVSPFAYGGSAAFGSTAAFGGAGNTRGLYDCLFDVSAPVQVYRRQFHGDSGPSQWALERRGLAPAEAVGTEVADILARAVGSDASLPAPPCVLDIGSENSFGPPPDVAALRLALKSATRRPLVLSINRCSTALMLCEVLEALESTSAGFLDHVRLFQVEVDGDIVHLDHVTAVTRLVQRMPRLRFLSVNLPCVETEGADGDAASSSEFTQATLELFHAALRLHELVQCRFTLQQDLARAILRSLVGMADELRTLIHQRSKLLRNIDLFRSDVRQHLPNEYVEWLVMEGLRDTLTDGSRWDEPHMNATMGALAQRCLQIQLFVGNSGGLPSKDELVKVTEALRGLSVELEYSTNAVVLGSADPEFRAAVAALCGALLNGARRNPYANRTIQEVIQLGHLDETLGLNWVIELGSGRGNFSSNAGAILRLAEESPYLRILKERAESSPSFPTQKQLDQGKDWEDFSPGEDPLSKKSQGGFDPRGAIAVAEKIVSGESRDRCENDEVEIRLGNLRLQKIPFVHGVTVHHLQAVLGGQGGRFLGFGILKQSNAAVLLFGDESSTPVRVVTVPKPVSVESTDAVSLHVRLNSQLRPLSLELLWKAAMECPEENSEDAVQQALLSLASSSSFFSSRAIPYTCEGDDMVSRWCNEREPERWIVGGYSAPMMLFDISKGISAPEQVWESIMPEKVIWVDESRCVVLSEGHLLLVDARGSCSKPRKIARGTDCALVRGADGSRALLFVVDSPHVILYDIDQAKPLGTVLRNVSPSSMVEARGALVILSSYESRKFWIYDSTDAITHGKADLLLIGSFASENNHGLSSLFLPPSCQQFLLSHYRVTWSSSASSSSSEKNEDKPDGGGRGLDSLIGLAGVRSKAVKRSRIVRMLAAAQEVPCSSSTGTADSIKLTSAQQALLREASDDLALERMVRQQLLYQGIAQNAQGLVQSILDMDPELCNELTPPVYRPSNRHVPVLWAIFHGYFDLAEWLVRERGACPDDPSSGEMEEEDEEEYAAFWDSFTTTPLCNPNMLVLHGRTNTLEKGLPVLHLLMQSCGVLYKRNDDQVASLITALVQAGVNLNAEDAKGCSAWSYYASLQPHQNNEKLVDVLLQAGVRPRPVEVQDLWKKFWRPFISGGSPPERIVAALLEAGADPNDPDCSALFCASGGGKLDIMRRLLAAGADVNQFQKGFASVNEKPWPGRTCLEAAAAHPDARALLLDAGLDVNAREPAHGWPLLLRLFQMQSSSAEGPQILKDLVARGADPTARGPGGKTLTHLSVLMNSQARALAAELGAPSPNEVDESGLSAIELAVRYLAFTFDASPYVDFLNLKFKK